MPSRHQKRDYWPAFQKRKCLHQKKRQGDETFKEKNPRITKRPAKTLDTGPAITNNTNDKKRLHVHFSEDEPIIIDIETTAQERKTSEDEIKIIKDVNMETRSAKTPDHQVSTNDAEPAITNNTNENAPLHVHYSEDEPVIIDIQTPSQERKTSEDEIEIIKEVLTPAKEAQETTVINDCI